MNRSNKSVNNDAKEVKSEIGSDTLYSDMAFDAETLSCLAKFNILSPTGAFENNESISSRSVKDSDLLPSLMNSVKLNGEEQNSENNEIKPTNDTTELNENKPNEDPSLERNYFSSVPSLGHHFVQQFNHANNNATENERKQPFDIPDFNFTDVSNDTYPKFLGQFDDEHYLNAERKALVGLNLPLSNDSQKEKF